MSFIANHVYILFNSKAANAVLDLQDGSTENGIICQSYYEQVNENTFSQQWLVQEVGGQPGVYTFRNLRSGTYLDLSCGSSVNGTRIQGWSAATPGNEKNQQWRVIQVGSNYRVQNVAGGTYIDLVGGDTAPKVEAHGWEMAAVPSQEWRFHRVSRAGHEVAALVSSNPYIETGFRSYQQDGLYIVLRSQTRNDLYNGTGLRDTNWRSQIFDCDDFAFVAKSEVAKWGNRFLRTDNLAILWGVMFGTNSTGGHAYNWFLNDDFNSITFFEPQNGKEMVDPGYKGYFGVY